MTPETEAPRAPARDGARARWEALATDPVGRWVRLGVEVIWYLALLLAVWACWGAPQAWFSYLGM